MQWEVASLIHCKLTENPFCNFPLSSRTFSPVKENQNKLDKNSSRNMKTISLADPRGTRDTGPLSVQFLSFSCSFRQKSCQIISFLREMYELAPPDLGNPGSATTYSHVYVGLFFPENEIDTHGTRWQQYIYMQTLHCYCHISKQTILIDLFLLT